MPTAIFAVIAAFVALVSATFRLRARTRARRVVCSEAQPPRVVEREHARRVERIARQLRERKSTAPVSLRKKTPSHQVPKAGDLKYKDDAIDVSGLDSILSIDVDKRVCVAEPGVAFVDLVAATLQHGLVPWVVPELKTITIGGAVSGCSIESMSFRCGGFHDTCVEYEVITATGKVLTCTPDNDKSSTPEARGDLLGGARRDSGEDQGRDNAHLFQMMHGSFGTLGILSKLKFKLVPAKPYVHVVYEKYPTLTEYLAAIERHAKNVDVDFIDGIIHSPVEYVLACGRFTDRAPYTTKYDWFRVYYASTRERAEDYMTTSDYFFRYDHGVTQVHPKSLIGRVLFGKFFGSTQLLWLAGKLNKFLPAKSPNVILDVFLPLSRVPAFLQWHQRELGHFPLWVVPYRRVRDYEWINPRFFDGVRDEMFVDIAIYGMKQPKGKNAYAMIERALMEIGGLKTLISHNFYTEEDFWKTFNRDNYVRAKRITDPNNIFRDLYTKTCRAARGLTT